MTKLTEAELAELLRTNPDVALNDPGDATGSAQEADSAAGYMPLATSERALQAAIFAEAERRAVDDPRWALLFAVPNGQYRRGQRPEPGMRSGVPDLCLPVASRGYHGLWVELKCGKGRASDAQVAWLKALDEQGYYVQLAWDSAQYVVDMIEWYLEDEQEDT